MEIQGQEQLMLVNLKQTVFAVPMKCGDCVKHVSDTLYDLGGISKVDANLKDQLVLVEGTAAPSAIVKAIQSTGRDAILRGSGAANSAAVSILESFHEEDPEKARNVRGLARMVQLSPTLTLVDLTVSGVSAGTYRATIREYGDLSDGAASTGPVWGAAAPTDAGRGLVGTVEVGAEGSGSAFITHPFQVWEVIGHAMVLTRSDDAAGPLTNDADTLVGIIARSAGIWENDKTVCSCSGKTLWEERSDERKKGML
ncbi:probable LYS7 - copper chaperone for superoxide dismutase Sod1p [Cephalotrichum gorgonifer]|uniref:Superoxide dismutase 1 copper chaperone n=1 Tax=Cephalotrichum gorgonifer TaxID=2041049 RepID=A0AAE8SVL0_9PEZI|nr:probable LYS7 - copper chaperone for superoxide dismutase Sod1p [Cephalotrichum gorgonifer]